MDDGSAECLIPLDTMACKSSEVNVHIAASKVNALKIGADVWNLGLESELELDRGLELLVSITRERESTEEFDLNRLCNL